MSGALPDEDVTPDGALWWTFERQSRAGHALTVAAGLAVWMAGYWLYLSVGGGGLEQAAAGGPDARAARRVGARVATAACWLWFALAFVAGKGGPGLNLSLYPTGVLVAGPYLSALAFVGRLPPEVFTAAPPTSVRFVAVVFGVFAPGFALALVVVGGFVLASAFVFDTFEAWSERHMPGAWHDLVAKARDRERE